MVAVPYRRIFVETKRETTIYPVSALGKATLLLCMGLLAGCVSSGDVERARQESAQAKAKMQAELQQERDLAASMERESEAKKATAEKLAKALGSPAPSKRPAAMLGASASGQCPNNTATNQLAIQMVDDSDRNANVLLVGKGIGWPAPGAPSQLAYLDLAVNPTGTQSAAPLGNLTPCGTTVSPYTGKTRNVYQFSVAAISSGRLMVSYDKSVAITNGNFPTGTEPYRWDKIEFGFPSSGADLTSMDFFSIPMQFEYLDQHNNVLQTMTYYTSTMTLLNQLVTLSPGTMTGASGAFLPTTWTPGQGVSGFYRVFGPSLLASNSSSGSPAPYPSFGPYLQTLVGQSFKVSGTGNAGCANQVSYDYTAQFASDGQGGYTVGLKKHSPMSGTPPCGIPPAATTAQGIAIVDAGTGAVKKVQMTNPGSDYFNGPPTVTFTGGSGSGASGTAVLAPDGSVSGVAISNGGTGYTSASLPTVTFSAPPSPPASVTLPPDLSITVHLPAPSANSGYDVNLYGAPATAFSVPTAGLTPQQIASIPNSLYAVIAGNFLAGVNFGYVGSGSTAPQNSDKWYSNPPILYPFGRTRIKNDGYYNPYAAVLYNLSDAYGFAYSDRGGRPSPYVPQPTNATTLRITILNDTRLDTPLVTVSNPTNTSLTLTWPPVTGATGYTVNVGYGGGIAVPGATLTPTTPSPSGTTISGLNPGTTYQISVAATGSSGQSYTVPVYGTTTGTMPSPSGSVSFATSLSWSVDASGTPPSTYQFTVNGQPITVGAKPTNATITGSSGLNVYGLTITDTKTSNTVYQGNYVVNLSPLTLSSVPPNVAFGAPPSGTTATGTTTIANGVVTGVTITNGGNGYTSAPAAVFDQSPTGTQATGTPTLNGQSVSGVTNISGGTYYMLTIDKAFLTPPNANVLASGWAGGSGSGFPAGPLVNNGSLAIGTPFAPVPDKQASTVCFPGHC